MKREGLILLNTAGLFVIAVGGGVFLLLGPSSGPPGAPPAAPAAAPAEQELADLKARVATLEAKLGVVPGAEATKGSEATPSALASPKVESVEADPDGGPAASAVIAGDPSQPPSRAEVKTLIAKELDARARRAAQKAQEAARKAKKPKRTLRQVVQELALTPAQETGVRKELRKLEGDVMRLLFEVKQEDDLTALIAKFEQAKHDPQVKDELRQQLWVNWTRRQADFWGLVVEHGGRLRKVLPKETLERYSKFDVKLDDPRFPDLETFFKEEDKKRN